MKAKLIALGAASLLALCACSSISAEDEAAQVVILGTEPKNVEPVILLQHQTSGKLACCRDTGDVTAEECARALEAECFVRVQDLPYRPAKYDFLTTDTYPTRRWRENEKAPRW